MLDFELIKKFHKYLEQPERTIPWAEMGLVKNAPKEAIEAYEEYIKIDRQREIDEDI